MPLDLGIDVASDYEEELRVEDIGGGRVIVFRPPTATQISAVSLEMVGKKRNEGAVRDMLDAIILSIDEVRALAYAEDADTGEQLVLDDTYASLIEDEKVVDLEFLIERLKDPHFSFNQDQFNRLVRYLLEQRSGFPTKPSSGSSSGRTTTGSSSTGNSRRAGSTRSGSRRAVSSA